MTQPNGAPANGPADAAPAAGAEGGDGGDTGATDALEAPSATNWWQFSDKDAAESWANNLITKRLSRERKTNLEPLQQTNATLEAELDKLRPLAERAMSDDEKREAREAQLNQEIEELRSFKTQMTRKETISSIADEIGLPASMTKFVVGDDEAALRESATDLLNALSEGGSTPGKRTPTPKAPKGDEAPAGEKAASGGGGNSGELSDEEMVARIRERTAELRKNGGFSVSR